MKFVLVVSLYVAATWSSLYFPRCGSTTAASGSTPTQYSGTTSTDRQQGTGDTPPVGTARDSNSLLGDRPTVHSPPSIPPDNHTMGYNGTKSTVIRDDNGTIASSVSTFQEERNGTMLPTTPPTAYTAKRSPRPQATTTKCANCTTRTDPGTLHTLSVKSGRAGATVTPVVTLISHSPTPSPVLSGRCEMYNAGPICQPYISNKTVFVDPDAKYSQDKMAKFLSYLLLQLNSTLGVGSQSLWPACQGQIKEALCRYFFPNRTTTPSGVIVKAVICRESCQAVFLDQTKRCTGVCLTAAGAAIFYARQKGFTPVHVDSDEFGCNGTILPSKLESNYTCQDLLSPTGKRSRFLNEPTA